MADATPPVNPLMAGTPQSLQPQPCSLVIFGGAGDLSWRKLLPAVYCLNVDGVLPSNFAVVGVGLNPEGKIEGDPDEFFRNRARDGITRFARHALDEAHWSDFARGLFFVEGSFGDAHVYEQLKARLDSVDQQFGIPGGRVFYLAVPPSLVPVCVKELKAAGLVADQGDASRFTRVIVEKPIGHDLESARQVNEAVAVAFAEEQTYRIDHYLGKETVQNLLVLRFSNSIFEPLWNAKYIDHVQITVAEQEGVSQFDLATGAMTASRVGYYEHIGAVRDMLQNHMLQVLCMTAMEPPYSLDPEVIRDVKAAVLHGLRPLTPDDIKTRVVRAQYIDGDDQGHPVPGYRSEVRRFYEEILKKPVPADSLNSTTETFVAMRLFIDNWRWAGVPFYLRTGKRLPKRASEVAIQFKDVPQVLYNSNPEVPIEPNVLSIRIQPEEGLSMRLASKLPGPKVRIYPVKMDFNYASSFGDTSPEAYERLILDVMAGDTTLFMRRDAVEAAWSFVMPMLDAWEASRERYLPEYRAGTWGPLEADRLIEADGRQWRTL